MEYIHRMSGARGDDAKKLLQDWIVNVMSKSWEYVVSGEVAPKVTPKDDPPIIPREQARKRDLSPFDPNDEPDVSIEYPGVTFEPPTKLMKGDLEYLSDISMEISSDSDSSPERNFYRSPQKVSHRAINNYKINKKPIILKNGKANIGEFKKDGLIETLDKSQKNDDCVNKGNEKIGKVNTGATKKDRLKETLDKSQKNDDCVNKGNEKIGKVNTGATKKDGLKETLDKSKKNDDYVNKGNEKIGKVNTGATKKDGLKETLDKSQKNDDCVNKGNEKIGKVNTGATKKDGLKETLDKSQKNDDCVNKGNEKIGKVNTGATKKDGLKETLDKSQKNDDCVNKGNEKIGKVNTGATKKDGLKETLDKSQKNDDCVNKANEKIGKVNTGAIKKDGLKETLDKSQKNDNCVNKGNEKIGKVNTGATKKDGLKETLDKSQKNDDCVNKGNEKIGKVNTSEIKKDGLIETLNKSQKKDDIVIKDSNIERKSITIEEYKQRVKTMDSLHKNFNNFNSSNVISDIISNMNTSYPLNAQESTYDINYNNTYPIQTQANSNQFNLDAELQRAVKSIQPPEYEAYVVNMEVDSESKPFVETNEAPIVEPVSSAIKTSFGSPAASYPILTSVDKNLQEDERIRSDLKQINKERVTLNIGGRNFETSYPILLRDEQSIFNVLFHEERHTTFFFDRDSSHFCYILNYLREDCKMDQIVLPKERRYLLEMLQEASFYRLEGLQQIIRKRLQQFSDLGLEF